MSINGSVATSLADDLVDTEQDIMFGGTGHDWFLGNLTAPNADVLPDYFLLLDKKTSL